MWILPKQLHTSAYVPDTAVLISDLAEQSQICELSLLARSKPSLARTWSQKWKRDYWTQHLSGRILKPSHGQTFVTAWTSSLEVIPASHSQQPGSDSDETTPDTSGLGSQMELELCDLGSASLRTSKDTSASDSEKSSANWKALVTLRRGEYSQRVKSAHLTSASESLSWPTARTSDCHNSPTSEQGGDRYAQLRTVVCWPTATSRDWKGAYSKEAHAKKNRMSLLPDAVEHWPTPTVAEAGKIGNQSNYGQLGLSNHPAIQGEVQREKFDKGMHGLPAPVNPSTDGSRLESWATPNTMDYMEPRPVEAMNRMLEGHRKNRKWSSNVREQVVWDQNYAPAWGTPTARDHKSGRGKEDRDYKELTPMVERTQNGKLNPRWVETLMGLPIGWTMPSCMSPLTIAPTNCDCLETESCQPPQPELF